MQRDEIPPGPGSSAPPAQARRARTMRLGLTVKILALSGVSIALVALIPMIAFIVLGVDTNIPFGGASILIVVGVGLETVKQIESQLQQRHYEGFLR